VLRSACAFVRALALRGGKARFRLARAASVRLVVLRRGRAVRTLLAARRSAGRTHAVALRGLPAGADALRLTARAGGRTVVATVPLPER